MEIGKIEISLDKKWELHDFSVFTGEYVQLYSFFYLLNTISSNSNIELDFSSYPWEGGYSVVNFFRKIHSATDEKHRLQIKSLQYSSPGFIELSGVLSVALDISALIGVFCGAASLLNKTYDSIIKGYNERKLAKLKIREAEAKLTKGDIDFIRDSVKNLKKDFMLTQEQIEALTKITKKDELIQLKILLCLFRRALPIANQQLEGKTKV